MKKIILLTLLSLSFTISAQITITKEETPMEIGRVGSMGTKNVLLEKYKDNNCVFTYNDHAYTYATDYKRFSFKDENNALENFYTTIIEGLTNIPKEDIKITTPSHFVWLHFEESLGVANVRILSAEINNPTIVGYTQYMTKRQVNKLFGKNK